MHDLENGITVGKRLQEKPTIRKQRQLIDESVENIPHGKFLRLLFTQTLGKKVTLFVRIRWAQQRDTTQVLGISGIGVISLEHGGGMTFPPELAIIS